MLSSKVKEEMKTVVKTEHLTVDTLVLKSGSSQPTWNSQARIKYLTYEQ